MKKKLEAELISIAHRILKLKNRAELDVLQQETLKLYEKISVLRFVEDNFNDVKPTIGYASAEETLEEIYGIEETPVVHANVQEAEEDEKRQEAKSQKEKESKAESQKSEEKPQATSDEQEEGSDQSSDDSEQTSNEPEGDADPEQPVEEYQASEEEKEHTEEETDEDVEEPQATSQELQAEETRNPQPETEEPKEEEPEQEEPEISAQPEIEKSGEDIKAMEEGAAAVYKKENDSTIEEEEQAADAEVITIEPDSKAKVEDIGVNFEFAFERKPAPDEPQKQKEISFEDFHDYKEPEFVKKGEASKQSSVDSEQSQSQEETRNAQPATENQPRDWRDWEPAKEEKPQATSQQPQAESVQSQSAEPTRNPQRETRSLNLGLNDRIAFEKNLFGGSGEDLNRVISQLNTFDSFDEAKEFIADMVKPDYNNWQGKEEYEERFMALVEKKFD